MRDGRVVQVGTPAELIIDPVDDYVADFTNEVPMVRVLTAGDVLDPEATADAAMPEQDCQTEVEALLPLLADTPKGIRVTRDGAPLGVVTASSVIRALAHQDKRRADDPATAATAAQ